MNSNLKNHPNSINTHNPHTWEEGQSRPSSQRDPESHDTKSRKSRNRAKANARVHEEAYHELDDYYDYAGTGYLFYDCELDQDDSCDDDYQNRDRTRKPPDPAYIIANETNGMGGPDGETRDEPKSQSEHDDPDLSCYTIPAEEPIALPLSSLTTHRQIDTHSLWEVRYAAKGIAIDRAIAAGRYVSSADFEPTPWGTVVPPRKSWHKYGILPNGSVNDGRLWPELYHCDYTCDYGLCYKTFGTPDACHLGPRCRWKHEIKWADLEFLIQSGRVSLGRARIMLANWQTPVAPKMPARACGRMYAMLFGLGEGLAGSQLLTR